MANLRKLPDMCPNVPHLGYATDGMYISCMNIYWIEKSMFDIYQNCPIYVSQSTIVAILPFRINCQVFLASMRWQLLRLPQCFSW